jgi:hypothetical protein
MRLILLISSLSFVSACAQRSVLEGGRNPATKQATYDLNQIQSALGMERSPGELGFTEKMFDSCKTRVPGGGERCGNRFFSVLNFKLSCRDSEGTVDTVASAATAKPLVSDKVEYQLAGARGVLQSDRDGNVQLRMVTTQPLRGQRLVVTVGRQFFGKEISEITQVILPNYWCE